MIKAYRQCEKKFLANDKKIVNKRTRLDYYQLKCTITFSFQYHIKKNETK